MSGVPGWTTPLELTVNGEPRRFDGPLNVTGLLRELGLQPPRVAVERNRLLVRRRDFDQTPLADGDRIEIVTLVGGG